MDLRTGARAGLSLGVDYRYRVLTAVCIVPATPLLVPELGGAAAAELTGLRDHALAAAGELARRCERWTVLGVQGARESPVAAAVGTFAGFGVDRRVTLSAMSPETLSDAAAPDAGMPLPLLIAGWLRELSGFGGELSASLIAADADAAEALAAGRELGARLAASELREGVLVVADGPTTLTPKAPGSFDLRAAGLDAVLRAAFAEGSVSVLASLDPELCAQLGAEGRAPWQVLAGLLGETPVTASGIFADAPYGVGYHTGLWSC